MRACREHALRLRRLSLPQVRGPEASDRTVAAGRFAPSPCPTPACEPQLVTLAQAPWARSDAVSASHSLRWHWHIGPTRARPPADAGAVPRHCGNARTDQTRPASAVWISWGCGPPGEVTAQPTSALTKSITAPCRLVPDATLNHFSPESRVHAS